MVLRRPLVIAFIAALAGCGIPSVNTATISQTPATLAKFSLAQRAANSCLKMPDTNAVLTSLKQAGFDKTEKGIISPDPDLIVIYSGSSCTIGLANMTPQQSYRLALPWAKKFGAITNAEDGDGLSDHAIQAWRSYSPERRINIVSYKTWPPDSDRFPKVPGAAAKITYVGLKVPNATGSSVYTLN